MWGGEGRPENASSFWDDIKGTKDNSGSDGGDPANQLAGFDARVNLAPLFNVPVSVYSQHIGEDKAGTLPTWLPFRIFFGR